MIRTNAEYKRALDTVRENRARAEMERAALAEEGFDTNEITTLMEPILSFHAQIADEVTLYERARAGEVPAVERVTDLGYTLIYARIASGLSQRDLADKLGVDESVVSRAERNEYHGVTKERAQRILDALDAKIRVDVDPKPPVHTAEEAPIALSLAAADASSVHTAESHP